MRYNSNSNTFLTVEKLHQCTQYGKCTKCDNSFSQTTHILGDISIHTQEINHMNVSSVMILPYYKVILKHIGGPTLWE